MRKRRRADIKVVGRGFQVGGRIGSITGPENRWPPVERYDVREPRVVAWIVTATKVPFQRRSNGDRKQWCSRTIIWSSDEAKRKGYCQISTLEA